MHVFGRLAPGVTASAAEADLETIRAGYGALHPEDVELQERRTSIVPYVQSDSEPGATLIVEGMFAFVVLVLVVACASVANLLLCRTMARRGEIAMRAAMGASRSRLVTQLFLEALLLTATAAAAGVGIAGLGLRWFKSNIPIENLPFWVSFGLDMPTALFTTAAALVAAALAGIAPALRATSGALQDVLKDQQRAMSGVRFGSVSGMLTVIEVTLAVAFLAAAGLAARSVLDATGTTAALPSREILVAEVQLAQEYSIGPDGTTTVPERSIPIAQWPAVAEDIRMAVAGLPGVRAVALATSLPVYQHAGGRIEIDGATGSGSAVDVRVIRTAVTPELLEVFGGRLLAGRFLTHADQRVSEPVAVVNRHLAERFFAGENPLGRRFRERTPGLHPWVTIVGVVDGLPMNPAGDRQPGYYRPLAQQTGPEFRMAARVDSAPTSLSAAVRDRVTRLDERITVADFKTHEDAAGSLLVAYRMVSLVFVGLGGTALFLAVAGLYAVMSFSVTQRTREIGIRVALGASAARVTATVLQRGLRQIAIGLVLGSAGGWALMRLLSYIPSGMSGAAPSLLVLAACTMLASGVCACLVPMVRTLRIHPVDALRQD
jgi:predicted permease